MTFIENGVILRPVGNIVYIYHRTLSVIQVAKEVYQVVEALEIV
jgi:hypothetical protein